MKYLVTGSYGFLGYNVCKKLLEDGHEVIGMDRWTSGHVSEKQARVDDLAKYKNFVHEECDLAQWNLVYFVFRKHRPDYCIHLAAQYSVPHRTEVVPNYVNSNCAAFMYVAEAAHLLKVKRFVYASSTWVSDHEMPWTMYGATKQFNEHAANIYARQFRKEVIGIRYGSAFGPHCRNDVGPYMTAKKLLNGQEIRMRGGFLYKTAFLHIDDAVDCTLAAVHAPLKEKWNVVTVVAHDERHDLREILRYMEDYTGIAAKIAGTYKDQGAGGIPVPELAHLKDTIGFEPKRSVKQTTEDFMDWFVEVHKRGEA